MNSVGVILVRIAFLLPNDSANLVRLMSSRNAVMTPCLDVACADDPDCSGICVAHSTSEHSQGGVRG